MPGVEDDLPAAALADVEHARDEPAGARDERAPGSIARRVGRRSPGSPSSSAGSSRAKRSGVGHGSPSGRTGKPPPTSSVSNVVDRAAPQRGQRERLADGVAPASTAPSCEPTWRWMPRGRSGPSGPPPASIAVGDLRLGHPELGRRRRRRPGRQRLGRDVRVEPVQDVERRTPRARRASDASAAASSGDSMATQSSGCAVGRGPRPPRAGRPSVLPMPSSVIRSFGHARPRGRAPTRRATPRSRRSPGPRPRRSTAGTSLALTEYWRTIGSGNASRDGRAASSSVARSVTKTGVAEAACRGGQRLVQPDRRGRFSRGRQAG